MVMARSTLTDTLSECVCVCRIRPARSVTATVQLAHRESLKRHHRVEDLSPLWSLICVCICVCLFFSCSFWSTQCKRCRYICRACLAHDNITIDTVRCAEQLRRRRRRLLLLYEQLLDFFLHPSPPFFFYAATKTINRKTEDNPTATQQTAHLMTNFCGMSLQTRGWRGEGNAFFFVPRGRRFLLMKRRGVPHLLVYGLRLVNTPLLLLRETFLL